MLALTSTLLLSLLSSLIQANPANLSSRDTSSNATVGDSGTSFLCPWDDPVLPQCECIPQSDGQYYKAFCGYVDGDWRMPSTKKSRSVLRKRQFAFGDEGPLHPKRVKFPGPDPWNTVTATVTPPSATPQPTVVTAQGVTIHPPVFHRVTHPLISALSLIGVSNIRLGDATTQLILNRYDTRTRGQFVQGIAGVLLADVSVEDTPVVYAGANWSIRWDFAWNQPSPIANDSALLPASGILGPFVDVAVQDQQNRLHVQFYFPDGNFYYNQTSMGDIYRTNIIDPMTAATGWRGLDATTRDNHGIARDLLRIRWGAVFADWESWKKKNQPGN